MKLDELPWGSAPLPYTPRPDRAAFHRCDGSLVDVWQMLDGTYDIYHESLDQVPIAHWQGLDPLEAQCVLLEIIGGNP